MPLLDSSTLYNRWHVVIKIRNRIDGGVPASLDLIRIWVESKTGHKDEKTKEIIDKHIGNLEEAQREVTEQLEESSWNTFHQSADGRYYLMPYQVKAMFRECATMLRVFSKKSGSKQIYQHGMEIKGTEDEFRIYINDCGEPLREEKPIHVDTALGKRNALKRTDYFTKGTLEFDVWILKTDPTENRHIGQKDTELMLTLAQENGLGANRSQGSGKFEVMELEAHPDNVYKAIIIPGAKEKKKKKKDDAAA
jgi:CRISPR/Cas system CSM-associated protein Csm4 (group 5 of RAMP superfamily)